MTDAPARTSIADTFAVYLQRRVLIVMFLGFSSGLPLALSGSTLLVWMREAGVDLGTIGLFALVGTPYTIKFLWAPLIDALDVPVLSRRFGRRRGWLLLSQFLLIAAIVLLGACDPAVSPLFVARWRAAGRYRVGDPGHRRRCLPGRKPRRERAGGRHGVLCGRLPHRHARLDGGCAVFGQRLAGIWPELPRRLDRGLCFDGGAGVDRRRDDARSRQSRKNRQAANAAYARENSLQRVIEAAVGAFSEFLTRDLAFVALAFVVLYKFTDALSGAMTAPFVIDLGFSRNEYAAIIKGVGLAATLIGGFAGGFLARALFAAGEPSDRRPPARGRQPDVFLAGGCGPRHCMAHGGDHRREFHQRHRHRGLRRLSVGAMPQSAAHGDPIRAPYRPCRSGTNLPVVRSRIYCRVGRLGLVLCYLCVRRLPALILLAWLQKRHHFDGLEPANKN